MKVKRHNKILEIIESYNIETQEELISKLKLAGFDVTQATVSRDIKDLGIIKVTLPNKSTKYAVLDRTGDSAPGRLLAVFSNSVRTIENAMNIVVIKTLPGMAQAAASALDSMHLSGIVGTIAGDDTVFVASSGMDEAAALVSTLNDLVIGAGEC